MSTDTAHSALGEMEYRTGQGSFGQDMSVSIPCQLRFTDEPTQNTRRFHVELYRRGYADLDRHADRKAGGGRIHYNGRICSKQHYKRMRVRALRGDIVRLYPHDGWEVTADELADVIEAIEAGFGSPVHHHPIDRADSSPDSE